MILLDAGNTRIKWRHYDAVNNLVAWGDCDWGNFGGKFSCEIGQWQAMDVVVLVSCVASRERQNLLAQALQAIPVVLWAESREVMVGLRNAYAEPSRLGVDRWLVMLALWCEKKAGFIVVDAGSAITIDLVGGQGQHRGGYILPGVGLYYEMLGSRTGLNYLRDSGSPDRQGVGQSTEACIAGGCQFLLSGLVAKIHEMSSWAGDLPVYVCGGDAGILLSLGLQADLREDLVFDGLKVWYEVREELI